MSSPSEWPTNLYQLGKNETIPWTAFKLRLLISTGTTHGLESGHVGLASIVRLRDALVELRTQDLRLYFDVHEFTLWLFECLHTEKSQADAHGIIAISLNTAGWVVEKTTQGSLTAKDPIAENGDDIAFSNLTKSVLLSALNSLASRSSHYSLGLYAGSNSPNQNAQAVYATNAYDPGELLSLWSLRLQWYRSGEIVLSRSEYSYDRFLYLSQILPYWSQNSPLLHKLQILLVPSGRVAVYWGNAATPSFRGGKGDMQELKCFGFPVSEADAWVTVKDDDNNLSAPFTWPAKFCLVSRKNLSSMAHGTGGPLKPENGLWTDSVLQAQIWYEQKDEREMTTKARVEREIVEIRQKEAQDARQKHHEQVDPTSPASNFLSTNDTSGIYPTPPDGLLFHAVPQDIGNVHISHENDGDGGKNLIGETLEHMLNLLLGSRSEDLAERDFDNSATGDLFGDLDEQGISAVGVTEDDFDFFDDTNAGTELELGHSRLVSDLDMLDVLSASRADEDAEAARNNESPSRRSQPEGSRPAHSQNNTDPVTGSPGTSTI